MITLLFVYFIAEKATNSPWGRVLRGIRDNENTMISSGKNVLRFKVEAFAFGAGIMGIGGALLLMVNDLLTLLPLNHCSLHLLFGAC